MPLKHHTETAYMILLGLIICVTGFLASLLPPMPVGLAYWAGCFVLALLYPIFLSRTFRVNRADKEFRILHWFPVGILLLWIIMELVGPKFWSMHILQLGFFFLWSLPLVAVGIAFIIIFAIHVLRRRVARTTILSIFLLFFTVGAVMAEGMGWNRILQRKVFPENTPVVASATRAYLALTEYAANIFAFSTDDSGSDDLAALLSSSAMSASSTSSETSSAIIKASSSSMAPTIIAEKKPAKLPKSGPESAAILGTTLMAFYASTLHIRAKRRG